MPGRAQASPVGQGQACAARRIGADLLDHHPPSHTTRTCASALPSRYAFVRARACVAFMWGTWSACASQAQLPTRLGTSPLVAHARTGGSTSSAHTHSVRRLEASAFGLPCNTSARPSNARECARPREQRSTVDPRLRNKCQVCNRHSAFPQYMFAL